MPPINHIGRPSIAPERRVTGKKSRAGIFAALLLLLAASIIAASGAAPLAVVPQPAWDLAFTRTNGWTGGDVAASVPLPGHRSLWLFGDSWIGRVADNRRQDGTLVNNAIAIQTQAPAAPGRPPAPDDLKFFWGPTAAAGKPTAWVRPAAADGSWFWPTGGGVVVPGPRGPRLALFLLRLRRTDAPGAFGFDCVGSVLALVDGVAGPVKRWRTRLTDLPHDPLLPLTPGEEIDWGTAALYEPGCGCAGGPPGWVYIYGVRADADNHRDLLLARVRPAGLASFTDWEFWQGGSWAAEPDLATPVVSDVASELSVERVAAAGEVRYLMVSSEPFLGGRILARTAPWPAGPWSAPREIYQTPAADRAGHRFVYAGHSHADLSPPGAVLVSYIVNSNDLAELIGHADLYRPRFVLVPMGAVMGEK